MTKGKFLRQIFTWMDTNGKVMEDVFVTFPNGDTITFADFWIQVVDDIGYGKRCLDVYLEMFE